VTFEGKIYGQLTFGCRDEQVQKHVTSRVVKNNTGRVSGIVFDITKPTRLNQDKTHEFYFNILLNDTNSYTVSIEYGTGTTIANDSISYSWDGVEVFQINNINTEINNLNIVLSTTDQQCPIFFVLAVGGLVLPGLSLNSQTITGNVEYYYNSSSSTWVPVSLQLISTPPTSSLTAANLDFRTINQYEYQSSNTEYTYIISWFNCSTIFFQMQTIATYYFNITDLNSQVTQFTLLNTSAENITFVFTAPSGYLLTPSSTIVSPNEFAFITVTIRL